MRVCVLFEQTYGQDPIQMSMRVIRLVVLYSFYKSGTHVLKVPVCIAYDLCMVFYEPGTHFLKVSVCVAYDCCMVSTNRGPFS